MSGEPWAWQGVHHLYYGLVLVGVALVVRKRHPHLAAWVGGVGGVLVVDDAAQHFLGVASPVKWLYGQTLWRLPPVRQLNGWLDHLFGR
jgi:hypothetical protein